MRGSWTVQNMAAFGFGGAGSRGPLRSPAVVLTVSRPTSPIMGVLTDNVMVAQEPACWNRLRRRTTTQRMRGWLREFTVYWACIQCNFQSSPVRICRMSICICLSLDWASSHPRAHCTDASGEARAQRFDAGGVPWHRITYPAIAFDVDFRMQTTLPCCSY